jgi:hypothetical protein
VRANRDGRGYRGWLVDRRDRSWIEGVARGYKGWLVDTEYDSWMTYPGMRDMSKVKVLVPKALSM